MAGAHSAAVGHGRPVDSTISPGGSPGSCGASPSPACAWRCPAAATTPGGTRRSPPAPIPTSRPVTARTCAASWASRSTRRRSRRNRATSGPVRCSRSRRCRTSSAQGCQPGLSGRCPVRRNSGTSRPICRRRPRAAAVRRRPGPNQPGLTPLPAPTRRRARPIPTPPARNPAGQVYTTPQGPAVTGGGTSGYQTITPPGGGSAIVVPNGNGTSTIIHSDGRIETVPTPR